MGEGVNYQPNYGFWDLDENGFPVILTHNLTIDYETRYELLELDENRMVRRLIGDRTTYRWLNFDEPRIDTLTVSSWIEVFIPRSE